MLSTLLFFQQGTPRWGNFGRSKHGGELESAQSIILEPGNYLVLYRLYNTHSTYITYANYWLCFIVLTLYFIVQIVTE